MRTSTRRGRCTMVIAALFWGCGGSSAPVPKAQGSGAREGSSEAPALPPGFTGLDLRNGTEVELQLDRSQGPSTPLSLIDLTGEQAPLGLLLPPHPCECPCEDRPADAACSCEQGGTQAESLSLPAGQTHSIHWDGRVRQLEAVPTGRCFRASAPPPGTYRLRACDARGRACAVATIELPMPDSTLELVLQPGTTAEPQCGDRPTVTRAVRVALAEAKLFGVEAALLSECEPEAASCGGRIPPRGDRCVMHVRPRDRAHLVTVLPAPTSGAPRRIEVRVDADAIGARSVDVAASRWGVAHEGKLRVMGAPSSASHAHGGAAAMVSEASFKVFNETGRSLPLRVSQVRWSTAGQCRPPGMAGEAVTLEHVERHGPIADRSPDTLTVRPGATTLRLTFAPQSAYQSHCRRFAVNAQFEAEGQSLEASAEVKIKRRSARRP